MDNTVKILYVEDCEITAELLERNLERYSSETNVSMDIAVSVYDAKARFLADEHVAALIDWNLPDGEGTDVAEFLRSLNPTLPIIFLSAMFRENHYEAAQKYSPVLCLVKDHSKEFVDSILNHISIRN
jgi:DNA-binding response OmpR family regulator